MTTILAQDRLTAYRAKSFRLDAQLALKSEDDAVRYVDERGFVLFWPIRGIDYPSLWSAVAGVRPVASEHDDPGHITWRWKDGLLDKRCWYYAKVIRGKSSMISLECAPYFYALSENFGEPESDYLEQYFDGKLSQPAKSVYEALLDEGPLDTVHLRRKVQMTSQASKSVFERTLIELQRDFKILPVGVSDSGAWRYCFTFDLVHRYYPEIPDRAREIPSREARAVLATRFFRSLGAATASQLKKLFSWTGRETQLTLEALLHTGNIFREDRPQGLKEDFYFLPELTAD